MRPGAGGIAGTDRRRHVVLLNWRDTGNPEGGGSERYVETVAAGLAGHGVDVTLVCARYPGARPVETRDGVRVVRLGGKLSVYPRALALLAARRLGRVDAVVDVQNGVPFGSRLVTRSPVVLVHHVHREQWPVVYGRFGARAGWWLESWLAPRLYRGCRYVAVSEVTKGELAGLGVDPAAITVVRNGTEPPPDTGAGPAADPLICVLGRLVPHKRVEHVLHAAAALRDRFPGLRVAVVGRGWWEQRLREAAAEAGVADIVDFHGFVSDAEKHRLLAASWVLAVPSLKEGWGLSVMEAAGHGVPAVAYASAGGLAESVVDGVTGVLVGDDAGLPGFTNEIAALLADDRRRLAMGTAARVRAAGFSWAETTRRFAAAIGLPLDGSEPLDGPDGLNGVDAVDLREPGAAGGRSPAVTVPAARAGSAEPQRSP